MTDFDPSKIRGFILSALDAQPKIDRETLFEHIAGELGVPREVGVNRSIGQALGWMSRKGEVYQGEDFVKRLTSEETPAPQKPEPRRVVQSNGYERTTIAPYIAQRDPRQVSIESSPAVVEDVLIVHLCISGEWIEIDSSDGLRICIGEEVPMWSPNQQTNYGVTGIRLTLKGGEVQRFTHNPDIPLTTLRKGK